MKMPRIQLSGEPDGMANYIAAVTHAGGVPLPGYAPAPDLTCDGLLLCGGGDPDPALFGQPNRGSHPPDPQRDAAELALIRAFTEAEKPILGICRGMQMLCVAAGGTLVQDLPPEQAVFHLGSDGRDNLHPVRSAPDSLLHRLYGPLFFVNSWHHQAVDDPGAGFLPIAWAESGFPEGMVHETLPILGVQFHPERMAWDFRRDDTADGARIFEVFLSRCRNQQ